MVETLLLFSLPLLALLYLLGMVATGIAPAGQATRKPASWIKPQKQIRTDYGTEAEQRLFGESVKERQLQALVCLPDGTLVCGYRRFVCGTLVGVTEFDVTILSDPLSESQIKVYRLTENIQRKDLSGWEMWQSCTELLCMNPAWSMKDLAEHLHFDPSSITRFLSPCKCVPVWQDALKAGKVGISDCYAASKLEAEAQASLLALKLSGASRDAIEAEGRKARNGTAPAVKVAKVKCVLPSGVQIVVSGAEVSLDESIEALSEAIKEMKRARDLGYTAKTFAAAMKDKASKA